LTKSKLWDVGSSWDAFFSGEANEIEEWLLKESDTSWAGDRIICAGDYSNPGDIPDDLFTEEEITEHKLDDDVLYAITSGSSAPPNPNRCHSPITYLPGRKGCFKPDKESIRQGGGHQCSSTGEYR
jgi:hypothetical protein